MIRPCYDAIAMLHTLWFTNTGLLIRIIAGATVFAILAVVDVRRHRHQATRWREYAVLIFCTLAALIYGTINNQISVTISPEYFLHGKDLAQTLGDDPPMLTLRIAAAKIGLMATWSAGLVFGVVLLLVNNPHRSLPRLRNRQLLMYLPAILLTAAVYGAVGGWLGYHGFLTRLDSDFGWLMTANLYRPRRFICAWGIHLGGYAGGLLGTIVSAGLIWNRRRRLITLGDHAV
jgi:hypothetical protein